ncbi:NADH-dependent flavin oxidoreductase-like protein [Westerdykella ornata]|uniref:NADH-dependent flavin oxidoreductase-like protein n=1 Tax=Westerdykella ornata TaxID=318751 RepID=A0A6A6JI90_WESOR|nr:NADH-dependent flavin oxidoreductase-like protein [Westerdykella ornata]KAF2276132.1 NADH-dependent flavin oxidoreductase-like protein [Westerdykella ornata]
MPSPTPYPPDHNPGVPNIPFFTPQHAVSPGAPVSNPKNDAAAAKKVPVLFTPLTIRGVTLRNRILVAPMCQYSCAAEGPTVGALTDYHLATLGHYALKGAALTMIEATGVQSCGRISPNCPGLWTDAQIPALRRISDFIKSQGSISAIQLAHAGRKASTAAPWLTSTLPGAPKVSLRATKDAGGWPEDVVGPMGGDEWTWDGRSSTDPEGGFWAPRALTVDEIQQLVRDWASAAKRAVQAGIQVIEIHAAHGYLISEFLSLVTNRRTDAYGGYFEGRTRLLVEVVRAVREVIPEDMPLFVRISATEWLEGAEVGRENGSWDVESSIRLAKMLPALGVDLLDVSTGGNHLAQTVKAFATKDYQTRIASRIRKELKKEGLSMFIGAVGLITEAEQARDIVEGGVGNPAERKVDAEIEEEARAALKMTESSDGEDLKADVILVARQFMREPEWVLKVAWKLGVEVAWPSQILRVKFPRL